MKKLASAKAEEGSLSGASPNAKASQDSSAFKPRPRRYIVDSGASFHLVDPRTLSKKEKTTIEDTEFPIELETANGQIAVTKRALVEIKELDMKVWAYLKKDTVCVLSLGSLVDRSGFTFVWKPGKVPELQRGKKRFQCMPSCNVPFIYSVGYLEERRQRKDMRLSGSLSGASWPQAAPSSSSSKPSLADEGLEKGEDSDTESDDDDGEVAIAPDDILQKMYEPMRPRKDVSEGTPAPEAARTRPRRGRSRG